MPNVCMSTSLARRSPPSARPTAPKPFGSARVTILLQATAGLLGARIDRPTSPLPAWLVLFTGLANAEGYAKVAMADLIPTPTAFTRGFFERRSGPIHATI